MLIYVYFLLYDRYNIMTGATFHNEYFYLRQFKNIFAASAWYFWMRNFYLQLSTSNCAVATFT